MSIQAVDNPGGQAKLRDDDLGRYMLHYLLRSRGVCEENVLLTALRKLCENSSEETGAMSLDQWQGKLADVIKGINVKLNLLDYKVVQISHGMGKNYVKSKSRDAVESYSTANQSSIPASNRFYVYIDVGAVEETKLATRFSQKELDFIKFAIQETYQSGLEIRQDEVPADSVVVQEVNRIRRSVFERTGTAFTFWGKYTTFAVGSSQLTQSKALNALETEDMIIKLCEYKWFSRNERGEISLDLRCIAELEDELISTYGFPACKNCDRLAIHGVMCAHDGHSPSVWHVDCYQYQIAHKGASCDTCGSSLLVNGIYVI